MTTPGPAVWRSVAIGLLDAGAADADTDTQEAHYRSMLRTLAAAHGADPDRTEERVSKRFADALTEAALDYDLASADDHDFPDLTAHGDDAPDADAVASGEGGD